MKDSLKEILKQEDTVLFIGSGVSLWSGLPSWSGLIKELVEYLRRIGIDPSLVQQELDKGELLQAASYGFDCMTKSQIALFVREVSRLGQAIPHEIHKNIVGLGPTCYVTTNYDNLLEQSFSKWVPSVYFRTVVNKQLIETAEIVGTRAKNFLFKLHGDASYSDSIVLTREQYRALYPGGELHHALEAAKTLMLSRPIVYIGFGLRDPDFLYLRDLLANTFKGGVRDHYAIMADVGEQAKEYWKKHFGLHIISYQTVSSPEGRRDHKPILDLLGELKDSTETGLARTLQIGPEFTLSLARHAAKYMRHNTEKEHIPLRVSFDWDKPRAKKKLYHYFDDSFLDELLNSDANLKFVLTGLPGAGKSYSIVNSVAKFAALLHQHCIEGFEDSSNIIVPIYADLKLYRGSIIDLLKLSIPVGVDLDSLCRSFKVRLYLDAFNEMPREFVDSNQWKIDFLSFFDRPLDSLVISSRTSDGLDSLEFPVFNIESIDSEFVKQKLKERQIALKGIFRDDVFDVLQKPFFFNLIFSQGFSLEDNTAPQKIHRDLLNLIENKFYHRFRIQMSLLKPLASSAVYALESGEEAFGIRVLISNLNDTLRGLKEDEATAKEIVNWLVSQDFIIPLFGERVCFFHQSVTEYLAATSLAELFLSNPNVLFDKLAHKRWDQALFLVLSLLKANQASLFLDLALKFDFLFTLSSVRYFEGDSTAIVGELLDKVFVTEFNGSTEFDIGMAISSDLPIGIDHLDSLKRLIDRGGYIGGSSVRKVLELKGDEFKSDAIGMLFEYRHDLDFCIDLGHGLSNIIDIDDLPSLADLVRRFQEESLKGAYADNNGGIFGVQMALMGLPVDAVYSLRNQEEPLDQQDVVIGIILGILGERDSQDSLQICANLMLEGIDKVFSEVYSITSSTSVEDNIDFSLFTIDHIKICVRKLEKPPRQGEAAGVLRNICNNRSDLVPYVEEAAWRNTGILRATLLSVVPHLSRTDDVFDALRDLLTLSAVQLSNEPFKIISFIDVSWHGHEALLVNLMKLRNPELTFRLCDTISSWHSDQNETLLLDIGEIDWWLEWYSELVSQAEKSSIFDLNNLSRVLSSCTSGDKRAEFILEFNNPLSQFREVLSLYLLPYFDDLTIGDFTENSIQFMLDGLKKTKPHFHFVDVLANIATDTFVVERLIPLMNTGDIIHVENLGQLIEKVGNLHKRRYLLPAL